MRGERARRREIAEKMKCQFWFRRRCTSVNPCFCLAEARAELVREACGVKRVKRGAMK